MGTISLRPAASHDRHFIHSTWLRSERALRKALLDYMIDTARFLIACQTDDPETILGWIGYSGPRGLGRRLLWGYVVADHRGQGLCRALKQAAQEAE